MNKVKKKEKLPSKSTRQKELKSFALGESITKYPETYAPEVLEAFDNKNPGSNAWTTFI